MNKVTKEAEKVTERALREKPETDRQAKKRQAFMPILGVVLTLVILGIIALIFGLVNIPF